MNSFIKDILGTFPEYKQLVATWWDSNDFESSKNAKTFAHCARTYPPRLFDILYHNEKIFADKATDTEFLPKMEFKHLWDSDIGESTKVAIWKHLSVIAFSIVGDVPFNCESHAFESVSGSDAELKLKNAYEHYEEFSRTFKPPVVPVPAAAAPEPSSPFDVDPSVHAHINEIMGGKIGKIAMELARETADEFGIDVNSVGADNYQDIFKHMFSDPMKLMGIVQNIGAKLKAKIASGELHESELMQEGLAFMEKMKNIPGLGNMKDLFGKIPGMENLKDLFGKIPGMGGAGDVDMGAMKETMEKNLKLAKMRERIKERARKSAIANIKTEVTEYQIQQQKMHEAQLIEMLDREAAAAAASASVKPAAAKKNKNKTKK